MIPPEQVESVDDFSSFGVHAFTTQRQVGSFGTASDEPVREVMARWDALRAMVALRGIRRLATASQIHGARVLVHGPAWDGWLRGSQADGHLSTARDTAMAVTIADCVPVFLAHPSGATAILHSGWRGTAARIIEHGIAALASRGIPTAEVHVHLGPAICGRCYEVSPEVLRQLTGETVTAPRTVDLRAIIASQARQLGVRHLTTSPSCTRCNNDRFFSHRAGDAGRQIAVVYPDASA
jgi:polyphenol oxidase